MLDQLNGLDREYGCENRDLLAAAIWVRHHRLVTALLAVAQA